METPLVSVLMTMYNREKYVGEAIKSVIGQTYKNWELIVVDDGSRDKSVDIVRSFVAIDPRIQLHINKHNLGDYPNRNKAASYANGKYLKYVDSDDIIYPYALEQLVFYMEQFPDAGYGFCIVKQWKDRPFPIQLSPYEAYEKHYLSSSLFSRAPLSAIIRKDAFEFVGRFSGENMVGDFELWNVLSQKYPVLLMPVSVGWNRVHDDQQMNTYKDPLVNLKYIITAKKCILSKDCPLKSNQKQIILRKINKSIARNLITSNYRSSLKKALQMKEYAQFSYFDIIKNLF